LIGVSAIFIFASFGVGLYDYVEEIAESSGQDLFLVQVRGIGAPGTDDTFKLEDKDINAIKRTQGVNFENFFYMKPDLVESGREKKYVYMGGHGTEPEEIVMVEKMFGVGIQKGRQFQKGDRGRVTLGYNYMVPDKIFSKGYDIGDKITVNGKKFDIIGFWESVGNPQDDSNVYMVEDDIKDLFGDDTTYAMLVGRVSNPEKIDDTVERIERSLRRARDQEEGKEDFFVQSYSDAIEQFTNVIDIVVGFIFLIVVISGVVASINTANTMITSVLERVQEIGVMKAIGATNDRVRNVFLLESSILGFIAGLAGVGIGWLLSYVGGLLLDNLGWGFLAPSFPLWLFMVCIVLATGVGALSGMFPEIYASKQNVVDALRYE
jgi:putative ABC transport system permease protein